MTQRLPTSRVYKAGPYLPGPTKGNKPNKGNKGKAKPKRKRQKQIKIV